MRMIGERDEEAVLCQKAPICSFVDVSLYDSGNTNGKLVCRSSCYGIVTIGVIQRGDLLRRAQNMPSYGKSVSP